jgi:formate dehydrogenase iron-sulfur subunit
VRGQNIEIVRAGSRGAFFLEPLIEVDTGQGRIGYGPVCSADAAPLFDAGLLPGGVDSKTLRKR